MNLLVLNSLSQSLTTIQLCTENCITFKMCTFVFDHSFIFTIFSFNFFFLQKKIIYNCCIISCRLVPRQRFYFLFYPRIWWTVRGTTKFFDFNVHVGNRNEKLWKDFWGKGCLWVFALYISWVQGKNPLSGGGPIAPFLP